jgi:hypothetical protein
MDALVYTYTRNDRFVTDGMGYGEEMLETLKNADGKFVVRTSRRTTTGRQTLSVQETLEIQPKPPAQRA